MIRELAHLAARRGRQVHLLQWDIARPIFEASAPARRYPMVDGVTHPTVRKAVGLWARRAIAAWHRAHAGVEHLLVGETPFVGGRLIELARPIDDAAEAVLHARACRFVIVVPSVEVRRFIESERERRAAHPRNAREREDAPPVVMRALWDEIVGVARRMDIAPDIEAAAPYDPAIYRRVYERLLRHRQAEVIRLDTVLATAERSVYDFTIPRRELVPDDDEAGAAVKEAESLGVGDVERWWAI